MEIEITRRQCDDAILVRRDDGSSLNTAVPHKGPVPHDAVHFIVERALGLDRAFWGLVAAGHHPDEIAALAKAAGHPSAGRAGVPAARIVELLQAERLVECFEAQLWAMTGGGLADDAGLAALAEAAWAASRVPPLELPLATVARIRAELAAFAAAWMAQGEGQTVRLDWTGTGQE